MSEPQATFPAATEMLRRLSSVLDNNYGIQERFYAILTKSAGQSLTADEIVVLFAKAIDNYNHHVPAAMTNTLYYFVEDWIKALVDDESARDASLVAAQKAGLIRR